jgi:hypothetical protein
MPIPRDAPPDAEVVAAWREEFRERYVRMAGEEMEATSSELEKFADESAAPFTRLAELSRRQAESDGDLIATPAQLARSLKHDQAFYFWWD